MLIARSLESEFLNALMGASWYTKFINLYVSGGNGAIGNLSKNDLDNQFVLIPLKNERDKLGKFFTSIENLITLHQCELFCFKIQINTILRLNALQDQHLYSLIPE